MNKFAKISSILFLSKQLICSSPQASSEMSFVETFQYNANNPIQDRITYAKLKSINGYTFSVFDGHGGDIVAQYAAKNLNDFLEKRLQKNSNLSISLQQKISLSLNQTYQDVQFSFYQIFKSNINNKKYRTVGACALTAVVLKDSIHIANAGDCEGIISGRNNPIKTNTRLNAGEPEQQTRLKNLFPNQNDIIKCIKNTNYCYVKGRLQPTRSLGDFYLKRKQYNFTNLNVFTGPYVQYKPVITHFKKTKDDRYLILATDGLWDQLQDNQVNEIANNYKGRLTVALFQKCVKRMEERNNISFQKMKKMSQRRDLHDDISIIIVDLQKIPLFI